MNRFVFIVAFLLFGLRNYAQEEALVNTNKSAVHPLRMLDMGSVKWTDGFWQERMETCKQTMVPQLWEIYHDATLCHSYKNFEIAAGLDTGTFVGPSFHDGDFYKVLESVAALYAYTKDPNLNKMMDSAIHVIGLAQRSDGYLYTKSIIDQKHTGKSELFDDKLSFEAYNLGHLMTAACVHYRATGKKNLLNIAIKATDFLLSFYTKASPEQARNAICPSHYMGIIEMYRTVRDPRYLKLAQKLIDIRGATEGTDDNSDRVPFRQMQHAGGHAVRANYLFAGVADVYAETGDTTLLSVLNKMWDDVTFRKMYITGGCGALYDGVSPDGTSYNPDTVQKVHQAYGRAFQLPLKTAHNETCANIGNLLWNWRMFLSSGDAKYMDLVELELYNGILSGVNLDGNKFFYTNALEHSSDYPYALRWNGGRQSYISLSNCCPPNIVRTIAEMPNYAYSIDNSGLYVNIYGSNTINTFLPNGNKIDLVQTSAYPWDGLVKIKINEMPGDGYNILLRIPGWCKNAMVRINNTVQNNPSIVNGYCVLKNKWKKGDVVELNLSMPVELMASNPLVEESRNRVAVKRGPIVYCLESNDVPSSASIFNAVLDFNSTWTPTIYKLQNHTVMALSGNLYSRETKNWNHTLYQSVHPSNTTTKKISARLIPYFAWSNRGDSDMEVWIPTKGVY